MHLGNSQRGKEQMPATPFFYYLLIYFFNLKGDQLPPVPQERQKETNLQMKQVLKQFLKFEVSSPKMHGKSFSITDKIKKFKSQLLWEVT